METAEKLNSYLQAQKKSGKIQMTNANKLKIEKQNIFWATEKYRIYLLKLLDLYVVGPNVSVLYYTRENLTKDTIIY